MYKKWTSGAIECLGVSVVYVIYKTCGNMVMCVFYFRIYVNVHIFVSLVMY